MKKFISFFNSNFFTGLATLITGGFVIWVYKAQKKQEKKDTATILLMEIRNAEEAIRQIKNTTIFIPISILPANSWVKFNHLFVKDLDQDELDIVNNFYNQCYLAETEKRRLSSFLPIAMEEKSKTIYSKLLFLAEKYSENSAEVNLKKDSDYTKEKTKLLDTYYGDEEWFLPKNPQNNLLKYINNIEFVTTNTAGVKLKKIAEI